MDILNFASYAKALKKGMPKTTNLKITNMLLNFIVDRQDLVNKQGNPFNINSSYTSLWWNGHEDIPASIKTVAASPEIIPVAHDYFEDKVITSLSPQKEDDTYSALIKLIESDSTMSSVAKNNLLSLYRTNEISAFLAKTFLYAVQKSNKTAQDKKEKKEHSISSINEDITKLNELLHKFPKVKKISPQDTFAPHEMIYISELLAAYADLEGIPQLTKENLIIYSKYKNHLNRQRKDYYAAVSIRESLRDSFPQNELCEFDILKEETYDGIIEVHEESYANGFERLNKVMRHAGSMNLNKSIISKIPGWISSSEKKGFCHMLVNDGEIKWVDEDE